MRGTLASMKRTPLTNQPEMGIERPVNKETAPDQILLRHRAPVAAVIAVVAVVNESEVAVHRHREGPLRRAHVFATDPITAIRKLAGDDSLEAESDLFRGLIIN